jgi:hypothetical protein
MVQTKFFGLIYGIHTSLQTTFKWTVKINKKQRNYFSIQSFRITFAFEI